jgi:hypothetical protein
MKQETNESKFKYSYSAPTEHERREIESIKKNYEGDKFLVILAIGLIILALISYISLCIKMPYSCTSNFRYIAYISLVMIILYSLTLENIKHKKLYDVSYFILGIFSMASSLFILFI